MPVKKAQEELEQFLHFDMSNLNSNPFLAMTFQLSVLLEITWLIYLRSNSWDKNETRSIYLPFAQNPWE